MSAEAARREMYLLACYLVSSARGLVDEPKAYGPLRLVDAASRLIGLLERMGLAGDGLRQAGGSLDALRHEGATDEAALIAGLDAVIGRLTAGLREAP